MDAHTLPPHIRQGLYVRAFLLCHDIERRDQAFDLLGVVTQIPVSAQAVHGDAQVSIDLWLLAVLERNGSRQQHRIGIELVSPQGSLVEHTEPALTSALDVECFFWSGRLAYTFDRMDPGLYRVNLVIDDRAVASAPFRFYLEGTTPPPLGYVH